MQSSDDPDCPGRSSIMPDPNPRVTDDGDSAVDAPTSSAAVAAVPALSSQDTGIEVDDQVGIHHDLLRHSFHG